MSKWIARRNDGVGRTFEGACRQARPFHMGASMRVGDTVPSLEEAKVGDVVNGISIKRAPGPAAPALGAGPRQGFREVTMHQRVTELEERVAALEQRLK